MAENKFVVKTIWDSDNTVLSSSDFATEKESEKFRDLMMYAMKLNYGENQTMVSVVIEEI